ncbi:S8 family serine peptidase [Priestia megaterium]
MITVNGTSFSAAYVSGIIANILANILAEKPNVQNFDAVLTELKTSSKDLGEKGLDNEYGNGLIQFK